MSEVASAVTGTIYLHGSKESNCDTGRKLGLVGDALDNFCYACYEVKLTVDVDTLTGASTITHVDDRAVSKEGA